VSLEAPEPLEAEEELVFLCHAPCMTLSGERPAEPCPRWSVREPLSLDGPGRVFLCLSLGWRRRPAGAEGWARASRRSEGQGSGEPLSPGQRPWRAQARLGFLV
jgi:hypothetical protein